MKSYNLILLLLSLLSLSKRSYMKKAIDDDSEDDYFKKIDFSNVVTYNDSNYVSKVKIDKPLIIFVCSP